MTFTGLHEICSLPGLGWQLTFLSAHQWAIFFLGGLNGKMKVLVQSTITFLYYSEKKYFNDN